MYTAGEAKIATGEVDRHGFALESTTAEIGEAYLPHSCDQWVIGKENEVRLLIADLLALFPALKEEFGKAR